MLPFDITTDKPIDDYTLDELRDGAVFLVDKPIDWTSFQVVNKLRHYLTKKHKVKKLKVGHAGTLDPLATGLLVICVGKKTKEIEQYQGQVKTYTGIIQLGATTPSYDLETEIDQTYPTDHITPQLIDEVKAQLTGVIQQYPPVFSAVKVNGKRAYESARKGEAVEIKPREVTIHSFETDASNLPALQFKVICSKGTYIRSLAYDFGKLIQSGAYLTDLRRTQIGEFILD